MASVGDSMASTGLIAIIKHQPIDIFYQLVRAARLFRGRLFAQRDFFSPPTKLFPLSAPPKIFFPNFFPIFFPTFPPNFAILRKNWSIFKIAQIELGVLLSNARHQCGSNGVKIIKIR